MAENEEKVEEAPQNNNFEMLIGLMVAVYGAILAIASIGGGKYGGDEILYSNESNKAYAWYQSKSIKNASMEAQKDLLEVLVSTKAIKDDFKPGVDTFIRNLTKKSSKYKKEMNEILKGSAKIDSSEWIQDKGGKLGLIIGAEEWEGRAEALGPVGDWFDYCTLFLNLCLVFGAICFVIQVEKIRRTFFLLLNICGVIGSILTVYAFYLAYIIP